MNKLSIFILIFVFINSLAFADNGNGNGNGENDSTTTSTTKSSDSGNGNNGTNPGLDCGNGKDVGNHTGNTDKDCYCKKCDNSSPTSEACKICFGITTTSVATTTTTVAPTTSIEPATTIAPPASTAGITPEFIGQFSVMNNPCGIAADSKSNVYITIALPNLPERTIPDRRVIKYDQYGKYLLEWGNRSLFGTPIAITVDTLNDTVYVVDQTKNQILVFNEYGKQLNVIGNTAWGVSKTGSSTFTYLVSPFAAIVNDQFLYVVDNGREVYASATGHGRVVKFTLNGKYIDEFPKGRNNNIEEIFWDISIDQDGNFYVLTQNCLYKFNPQGNLLKKLGSSQNWYTKTSPFNPFGITINKDNDIFISDRYNDRILIYNIDLIQTAIIGSRGSKDDQFYRPYRIVCDRYGTIFVADGGNKRVCKYAK